MSIIKDLLTKISCHHDWKFVSKIDVCEYGESIPYKIKATYICHKCGKFKKVRL